MDDFDANLRPFIDILKEKHSTIVKIREILTAGKSGAIVAVVDCAGTFDGIFILKIGKLSPLWESEQAKHRQAILDEAFGGRVPAILEYFETSENYALLISLAGDSRLRFHPLADSIGLFSSAYGAFTDLTCTTVATQLAPPRNVFQIISDTLSYRLNSDDGGRIYSNCEREFGSAVLSGPSFVCQDRILPNPLHYLKLSNGVGPDIRPVMGPSHGDLHSHNIFISTFHDGSVDKLFVIDLASYKTDGLYLFDHAYLELSSLLAQLRNLGEARWLTLATALSSNTDLPDATLDETGWFHEITRARTQLRNSLAGAYPNRSDDLEIQFVLAQISAGLAFLNKLPNQGKNSLGLSTSQYRQALIWASVNFRRLFDLVRYTPDNAGQLNFSLPVLSAPLIPFDAEVEGAIQSSRYFDKSGFNIIVLPAGEHGRNLPPAISQSAWNLVLDFDPDNPDISQFSEFAEVYRQCWPTGTTPDPKILNRGAIWYSANGRSDISDSPPETTTLEWRRKLRKPLDDLLALAASSLYPPSVRVLIIGNGFELEQQRLISESLDTAFGDTLCPILVGWRTAPGTINDSVPAVSCDIFDLDRAIQSRRSAAPKNDDVALLPKRSGSDVLLQVLPREVLRRVERDLTVIYRALGNTTPPGRLFAIDFHRGLRIEWAEIAQGIDVRRDVCSAYESEIRDRLAASSNHTINLLHEPSAGGTTLSRRIAWNLMEEHPVVVIDQLSPDTPSYLREIFQFSSLPVLVIMEGSIVTESERETLLATLREDNTRAVFLWVSRVYGSSHKSTALPAKLTNEEADLFLDLYLPLVDSRERRNALQVLARGSAEGQRNPFFFGLTAFGERYVGVEALVSEVLDTSDEKRALIANLSLVSLYSNEGFPLAEFNELCNSRVDGDWPISAGSLFVLVGNNHVRVSHSLLAERALEALSRDKFQWRADLYLYVERLLDDIRSLKSRSSNRIQKVIQTLFFTRDIGSALQADTEVQAGAIASQRRFSPLINDLGSVTQARAVLRRIIQIWPNEAHYVAHLIRHLLYEEPKEIEEAVSFVLTLERMAEFGEDSALVHVSGMAFRVRMEQRLKEAVSAETPIDSVLDSTWDDFTEASNRFVDAAEMNSSNEYGLVGTIQIVGSLVRLCSQLTESKTIPEFLGDRRNRRFLDAIALAEDAIDILNDYNPSRLSLRAQRTIAEWQTVYGNIDRVIADLRAISANYQDTGIRRALCAAIIAKAQRQWTSIPAADLNTIRIMMERNINEQGVRDSDIRRWLRAYRLLSTFDVGTAIERLEDWHKLSPTKVDPAFYLYAFYFIRWQNTPGAKQGLATETLRWLAKSRENRPFGQRAWSFEWLTKSARSLSITNYNDLGFDPPSIIRQNGHIERPKLERSLARIVGTLRDYRGPQQASLDLGNGLTARITPLGKLNKDDEGRRVSAFISLSYDGIVGWDAERMNSTQG